MSDRLSLAKLHLMAYAAVALAFALTPALDCLFLPNRCRCGSWIGIVLILCGLFFIAR